MNKMWKRISGAVVVTAVVAGAVLMVGEPAVDSSNQTPENSDSSNTDVAVGVVGIPEGQVRDTEAVERINKAQLAMSGADVSATSLLTVESGMTEGLDTVVAVEVTGAELVALLENSASYYNTYKPGDLTISFNQSIAQYDYDMFQGVHYTIDISEEPGSRIKDVTFNGEALADDAVLKLAMSKHRYNQVGPEGSELVNGTPHYESAANELVAKVEEQAEEAVEVDHNWVVIGTEWKEELRTIAVEALSSGAITIPTSADGVNIRAITESDLVEAGIHPEYVDHFSIVHINDSHGRIKAGTYDGMGIDKVAGYVEHLEAAYGEEDLLVLDAGDTLHGMPIINIDKGEGMVALLDTIGFDATVAGNHDFNYGYERLMELNEIGELPILGGNVTKDGESVLDRYTIKDMDGKKVGIFGLSTPETTTKTHPNNVAGIVFEDPIAFAQEMVEELKAQEVDMIIALTHLGLDEDSLPTSEDVAEAVQGIDLIVDGHSHTVLPEGMMVGDTMIVQTGEYTKNIGQVNVFFKEDGTMTFVPLHVTKAESSSIVASSAAVAGIEALDNSFDELTSEIITTVDITLDGEREIVRTGESNLGNLITNAIQDLTGADMVLTNGGGIRVSVESGEVTKADIIAVLPFGNTTVMIEATGAEILEALEHGVSKYPETNGAFPHVAGMSYTFDAAQPAGSRIVEVLVGGEALQADQTYTLGTNDFLAAGGDNYDMFKDNKIVGEFHTLEEAVIMYLQEKGLENIDVQGRINALN